MKVGLVGYGWWGKTIARQLANSSWLELSAVAEVDANVRSAMSSDPVLAGVAIFDSPEHLMAHSDLEAVILCTPHQQHAAQMLSAANAGLHIFCEKPLCLTLADAQRAVAQCQDKHLVLGIGHERRFEPEIIAMRQLIANGDLGEILQIEANFSQDKFFALPKDNWRLSNTYAPVGPLTATGIHLVDLSIALLGPCESLWARLATLGSDFENGDTLGIMMGFPNGANAMISAVLATPFEGRFAVYGSKGWIEIRDRTHPENPTGWDITTVLRGQEPVTRFSAPHPTVLANLEAFAKAIRNVAPYPVTSLEMLANVAALEAIMTSVKTRGLIKVAAPH
ncbi:Gfo/Idh/MocA family oxidoreductase [Limnohabitans sp.]|uniref:Gfo/Idh/MocA family protein n=1 Tax=Limnohabitans sp. TaxID=1907725 RepID=UPI00333E61C9